MYLYRKMFKNILFRKIKICEHVHYLFLSVLKNDISYNKINKKKILLIFILLFIMSKYINSMVNIYLNIIEISSKKININIIFNNNKFSFSNFFCFKKCLKESLNLI